MNVSPHPGWGARAPRTLVRVRISHDIPTRGGSLRSLTRGYLPCTPSACASEKILHGELEDSRIQGLANHAERPAAEIDDSAGCPRGGGGRIQRPEAVGHIVGFRADLNALALGQREDPGKREIETPGLQAA